MKLGKELKNKMLVLSLISQMQSTMFIFQEINALLSGELTEEDEAAVDDELEAILNEQMPDAPKHEPEVEDTTVVEEPTPKKGTIFYHC